ncbi:helix-turn-helix transcriptional regulator [Brevibacterium sp. JNUCC-42]|nr:helix-turn-helix transcriptional regulator [Brevibacterium sp. JNUCC-42]
MKKHGAIMQMCREQAGMSQEQLAEKLHRSRSCISKFENDKKIIDLNTFLAWIEVTGAKDVAVAVLCGVDSVSLMQNVLTLIGGCVSGWVTMNGIANYWMF